MASSRAVVDVPDAISKGNEDDDRWRVRIERYLKDRKKGGRRMKLLRVGAR